MSKFTVIYGYSDDGVELSGEISDEYGAFNCGIINCETSLGTKFTIQYNGEWKIEVQDKCSDFVHLGLSVGDDGDNHTGLLATKYRVTPYSDYIVFDDIDWVIIGDKKFVA